MVTFANIYSPCDMVSKRRLWETLKEIKAANIGTIWCIMGDFSCMRRVRERQGEGVVDYGDCERREQRKVR